MEVPELIFDTTSFLANRLLMGTWVVSMSFLATVNSAAMNIGVHVSFQIRVFFFFWIYTQEWNCWIIW